MTMHIRECVSEKETKGVNKKKRKLWETKPPTQKKQQTKIPSWQLGLKSREKLVPMGEERQGML